MAFQRSGFQRNAFQIPSGNAAPVAPVFGAGWDTPAVWRSKRLVKEVEQTQARIESLPPVVSEAIKRAAQLESASVERAFRREMQGTEARFLKNYMELLELYHGDLLAKKAREQEEEEFMLILLMSQ